MGRKADLLLNSWKIARAYWFSEEKWAAWGLLLMVVTLNLGVVYITVLLNGWHATFYEVIQNYNYRGFIQAIAQYSLLAICLTLVRGYQIYTRMMLHIRWRSWMTERYLSEWLHNKTYYLIQLSLCNDTDNPDQRISEDVELFVWLTLRLSLDLLQDIVTILSFVFILWNLSGVVNISWGGYEFSVYGYLVWVAILYAVAGSYWTVKLGRPLIKLDFDQQRYEADFRFSLMRLRENSESIALYGGERQEKLNFCQRFKKIADTYSKIIVVRRRLMWLTSGYARVSAIFASLVASPRYFNSQIHLGQMFQIVDAYNHVQTGFSFIVDSFTQIAHWRAVVNRLNNFLVSMEMVRAQPSKLYKICVYRKPCTQYLIDSMDVFLPDGGILIKNFSLSLKPTDRLIITGPSGCGKSTLLRTLSGIWPYSSGTMIVPDGQKIMFVPQKSYMPLSSLRDSLLYPGLSEQVSDGNIKTALVACNLPSFFDRLNIVADWGQTLSLGEQQRVAFVRVLLQKPDWLFLDEATSAMDERTEHAIYQMLTRNLAQTAIISVGHRSTLLQYHHTRLVLDGKGSWHLD